MVMDSSDDSDGSEGDDFQDVKSKSALIIAPNLILERKKKSKDPAAFATAMSAILSSSLKAHSRAVLYLPFIFLILGSNSCSFKITFQIP
jgi:hypothetical protein